MAVSPDGRTAVTGSSDQTLKVWDLPLGMDVKTIRVGRNPVTALVFSPDGELITGHANGRVMTWDIDSGVPQDRIKPLSDDTAFSNEHRKSRPVHFVTTAGDGRFRVAGLADGTVRVLDTQTEVLTAFQSQGQGAIGAGFAVAPGGGFAIRSSDLLESWPLTQGQPRTPILIDEHYHLRITAIAVSPDGRRAVSFSESTGFLALWDLANGERGFRQRYIGPPIDAIRFTGTGREIACVHADGSVSLWVAGTLAKRWHVKPSLAGAVRFEFLPGSDHLLLGLGDGSLELRDTGTGDLRQVFRGQAVPIERLAVSTDGAHLATGSTAGTVALWRLDTLGLSRHLTLHSSAIRTLALSADAGLLGSTGDDGSVVVRDLTAEKNQIVWAQGGGPEPILALSESSGHFFLTDKRNRIQQLDLNTRTIERSIYGHMDIVTELAVSKGGRFLLSGARDGAVRYVRLSDGHEMWRFDMPTDGEKVRIALSQSQMHAAVAGAHGLYVLDLESGRSITRIKSRFTRIRALTFTADGSRIVVGGDDGGLRIYRTDGGRLINRLTGHAGAVTALAVDPLTDRLFSSAMDRTIRLWDLDSGSEMVRLLVSAVGEWVAVTPDGYYQASAKGSTMVRWRRPGSVATFASELRREAYNRPDLIQQRLSR